MMNAMKRLAARLTKTPRRLWTVSFVIFFALAAAWSVSTPTGASPDEHAHYIRAAAVARGQFEGREVMVPHNVGGIDGKFAETGVQLPKWYQELKTVNSCYAFQGWQPASCAPALGNSGETAEVTTAAGRYNPLYYLAVGWPSRLVPGEAGLYLMRLVSAAICAALAASAVLSAAEWRRRSFPLLGLVAAATPMALFMFGVVNPSGPEIAAGILVWSTVLPVLMEPDPKLLNRRLARLGVGAVVLINIRPLGIIWFCAAVAAALVLQQRSALRSVVTRRAAWFWGLCAVVAMAGALAWTKAHPDNSVIQTKGTLTPLLAARKTFDNSLVYFKQMVGYFGWLDNEPPAATLLVWCGIVLMLLLLALCFSRVREAVALLGLTAGLIIVPVAAQTAQSDLGMVWQGRYLLPFAVGLPLTAAAVCAQRAPRGGMPWRRLIGLSVFSLAAVNVAGFVWALRRNTVGVNGPLLLSPAKWAPPVGWPVWVVVYALAALLLAALVLALSRDEESRSATEPGESSADSGGGAGRRHRRVTAIPADA